MLVDNVIADGLKSQNATSNVKSQSIVADS